MGKRRPKDPVATGDIDARLVLLALRSRVRVPKTRRSARRLLLRLALLQFEETRSVAQRIPKMLHLPQTLNFELGDGWALWVTPLVVRPPGNRRRQAPPLVAPLRQVMGLRLMDGANIERGVRGAMRCVGVQLSATDAHLSAGLQKIEDATEMVQEAVTKCGWSNGR